MPKTPEEQTPPAAQGADTPAVVEPTGVADDGIAAAFAEDSAGSHFDGLSANEGQYEGMADTTVVVPPEAAPATQVAPAPTPQGQQQQASQAAPTAPSAEDLLRRMMAPAQQASPWGPPQGQQSQQYQPQPQAQQPQAQPAFPADPNADWTPFTQAIQLPPQLMALIDSDNPAERAQGIGSAFAAFGNTVAKMATERALEMVRTQILPQAQQQIVGQVDRQQAERQLLSDVYSEAPQALHAHPDVIKRAFGTVIADELQRNPNAVYTPAIGKRTAQLVAAFLTNGQAPQQQQPQFQAPPQQQQYAPQPGYAPQPYPQQGYAPQPQYQQPQQGYGFQPQPSGFQPQPYMAGQNAGSFNPNFQSAPTPASEVESFMNGGWG